jgi:hypothetical protein
MNTDRHGFCPGLLRAALLLLTLAVALVIAGVMLSGCSAAAGELPAGPEVKLPDPQSPQSIGWVCIVGVCIIIGFRQVVGLVRDMKSGEAGSKRDVTINTGMPTKAEFEKHVERNRDDHEKFDERLGQAFRAALSECEKRVEKVQNLQREEVGRLHTKIEAVGREVSALGATNVLQNQKMAGIDSKLDRLIERGND